uniref:Secreted protein n=1 Tax=Trichogramma kaykai TaxID=54128 RepID=A0ABD2X4M6_9HYME
MNTKKSCMASTRRRTAAATSAAVAVAAAAEKTMAIKYRRADFMSSDIVSNWWPVAIGNVRLIHGIGIKSKP